MDSKSSALLIQMNEYLKEIRDFLEPMSLEIQSQRKNRLRFQDEIQLAAVSLAHRSSLERPCQSPDQTTGEGQQDKPEGEAGQTRL